MGHGSVQGTPGASFNGYVNNGWIDGAGPEVLGQVDLDSKIMPGPGRDRQGQRTPRSLRAADPDRIAPRTLRRDEDRGHLGTQSRAEVAVSNGHPCQLALAGSREGLDVDPRVLRRDEPDGRGRRSRPSPCPCTGSSAAETIHRLRGGTRQPAQPALWDPPRPPCFGIRDLLIPGQNRAQAGRRPRAPPEGCALHGFSISSAMVPGTTCATSRFNEGTHF